MSIYDQFCKGQNYNPNFQACIEETTKSLENQKTDVKRPGMLLGKIQSGKTKIFMGVIALVPFPKRYYDFRAFLFLYRT